MNWSTFEDAIQTRIAAESGITVIWADQTADRPAVPFITLTDLSEPTSEHEEETFAPNQAMTDPAVDAFVAKATTHPEPVIQLVCFTGPVVVGDSSAVARMRLLRKKIGTSRVVEALEVSGIAMVGRSAVQTANAELENKIEGRAIMTLTFRIPDSLTETVGRFDKVIVETVVDRDNGNPPVDKTIEIDLP